MKEDVFNTSIRKLLREFGVTAQREIEKAVRQAVVEHRLEGSERLPTTLTLSIPTVGLTHTIEGDVDLG
jgi:Family of unknown function (DUF6494)